MKQPRWLRMIRAGPSMTVLVQLAGRDSEERGIRWTMQMPSLRRWRPALQGDILFSSQRLVVKIGERMTTAQD